MRFLVPLVTVFLLAPSAFGQKKEVQELMRDVALLQNEVRSMKSSMDEKFAALNVLVKEALDNASKSNTSLAVLEKTMADRLREQQTALNAPVAGVNTKMDQMATEFAIMKESVTEVAELIRKLQSQLRDLDTKVTTLNAPPPPPPGPAGMSGGLSSTPPAGLTSEALYTNALQSKSGNQLDFAMQQFQDYLRYFPDGSYAPNAQYHIGEILAVRGRYDDAVTAFDNVIEKYPENSKTLDAMLSKGRALAKSGQRTAAVKEFRAIIAKAPNSGQSTFAKQELKDLGMPYTPPAARKR
jgi:tol-pal system protein YbgF